VEQKERDALKERIASLINHGLDNRDIAEELKNEVGLAAKLIALIRDYQMDTENLVNSKGCIKGLECGKRHGNCTGSLCAEFPCS